MSLSDERTLNQESKLILAEMAALQHDFAELRYDMTSGHANICGACDRIDGQLNDISQILRKTNRALSRSSSDLA